MEAILTIPPAFWRAALVRMRKCHPLLKSLPLRLQARGSTLRAAYDLGPAGLTVVIRAPADIAPGGEGVAWLAPREADGYAENAHEVTTTVGAATLRTHATGEPDPAIEWPCRRDGEAREPSCVMLVRLNRAAAFASSLHRVEHAVGTDPDRPSLGYVWLWVSESGYRVDATDGHRLARVTRGTPKAGLKLALAPDHADALRRLLERLDDDVAVDVRDGVAVFAWSSAGVSWIVRVPAWDVVCPAVDDLAVLTTEAVDGRAWLPEAPYEHLKKRGPEDVVVVRVCANHVAFTSPGGAPEFLVATREATEHPSKNPPRIFAAQLAQALRYTTGFAVELLTHGAQGPLWIRCPMGKDALYETMIMPNRPAAGGNWTRPGRRR